MTRILTSGLQFSKRHPVFEFESRLESYKFKNYLIMDAHEVIRKITSQLKIQLLSQGTSQTVALTGHVSRELRSWNRIGYRHGMLLLAKIEKQDAFRRHIIAKSFDYREDPDIKKQSDQSRNRSVLVFTDKNEAREGMSRNQSGNQWTSDLDVHDKWLKIGSSFCPTEVTYLSCLFYL